MLSHVVLHLLLVVFIGAVLVIIGLSVLEAVELVVLIIFFLFEFFVLFSIIPITNFIFEQKLVFLPILLVKLLPFLRSQLLPNVVPPGLRQRHDARFVLSALAHPDAAIGTRAVHDCSTADFGLGLLLLARCQHLPDDCIVLVKEQ